MWPPEVPGAPGARDLTSPAGPLPRWTDGDRAVGRTHDRSMAVERNGTEWKGTTGRTTMSAWAVASEQTGKIQSSLLSGTQGADARRTDLGICCDRRLRPASDPCFRGLVTQQ